MESIYQTSEINNYLELNYSKKDYYVEVFKTQKEMADLICIDIQNERVCFRNIMKKLSMMVENGVAVDESKLKNCKKQAFVLDQQLEKNTSRNRLIKKVIEELENIERTKMVVRNLTLNIRNDIINIDIAVVTSSAVFLLELKNPNQNVNINEQGFYYRINKAGKQFDKNILDKINEKASALKSDLIKQCYNNLPVIPYLVFCNNNIDVINECKEVKTCFINEIANIIDEDENETIILYNQIKFIYNKLKFKNEKYISENDVYNLIELKNNFAELLMGLNLSSESEIFQFLYGNNVAA